MNALDILVGMKHVDFSQYSDKELEKLKKELINTSVTSKDFLKAAKDKAESYGKAGLLIGTTAAGLKGTYLLGKNGKIKPKDVFSTIGVGSGVGALAGVGKSTYDYTVKKNGFIKAIDKEMHFRKMGGRRGLENFTIKLPNGISIESVETNDNVEFSKESLDVLNNYSVETIVEAATFYLENVQK